MERVTLTTERLVLRPWRLSDNDSVLAYAADELWSRYLPVPFPYTETDGEQFVARAVLSDWATHPLFAVTLDGMAIGGVDLHVRPNDQVANLGYSLARANWGRGMTAEAARAVIDWAFDAFQLEKVSATADLLNTQSWRVMEKLGMQREGLLRSDRILRGRRTDVVLYGILKREWKSSLNV